MAHTAVGMIDAYASYPHLFDHIAPIWRALDERGTFYVGARRLLPYAQRHGIDVQHGHVEKGTAPVLVANHHDLEHLPPGRAGIFVEHGAGQSYADLPTHPAFSGGERRAKARLYLALNDATAARDAVGTPGAQVAVVGSPRLDTLHAPLRWSSSRPVVAVAWHWDCALLPETRWAWPHYRKAVARLSKRYTVLGHGHPRVWSLLAPRYEQMGIEPVQSFAEVVRRAQVVVVDNTSAGPEAAACGLPVVWANAPWYRRDVEHGGRFWQWPRGQVQCDDPDLLGDAVAEALADTPEAQQARHHMVDAIYPEWTRGRAAALAAAAVRDWRTDLA